MKYLIGNTIINANHIVRVVYMSPEDQRSTCRIIMSDVRSVWLRGKEADWFWDVYSKDAYCVFAAKAEAQA